LPWGFVAELHSLAKAWADLFEMNYNKMMILGLNPVDLQTYKHYN
jgi:hypothetical protein